MFHHLAVYYRAGWIKYKHNKCIDSISYNDSIDTITYEWMWYDHDYMENIWRNLSDMLRNEQYTWKVNSFLFSTNWNVMLLANNHYSDVIMNAMASHITSFTIIYSTVYSGADQGKH